MKTTYGILFAIFIYIFGIKTFLSINGKKENLIKLIIALELKLLAVGLLLANISFILDDKNGVTLTLLLLPLAGAESALILAIYIGYYPIRGTLSI